MRRVSLALPLVLVVAGAGCSVLDQRSLAARPEYGAAIRLATARAASAERHRGPISAGWSRAEILVPPGAPLAGYGARRGAPHEGQRDVVAVRAFAFEHGGARALLFTADVLFVPEALADEVREALAAFAAVPRDSIFFTASHTHSGPGGFAEGLLFELAFGSYDPRARDAVLDAFARAATGALADLEPAEVGADDFGVPGTTQNRVESGGAVDDVLLAVHLRHPRDGSAALFWSFGCHATTLGPENRELSSDYPGAIAGALEGAAFEVVGFAAGGVGSAVPKHDAPATWVATIAHAVERAAASASRRGVSSTTSAWATASIPLLAPDYRAFGWWPVPAPLVTALIGARVGEFGALAIGDLRLMFVPAELSGTLTRDVRRTLRARGLRSGLLPFSGSYAGYVVPRRVLDLPRSRRAEMYEYETKTVSFFGRHAADFFLNVALRLGLGLGPAG